MVDHAITNAALRELIRRAAVFGGIFDPHAMEVERPLNPTTTPAASQTIQDDAVGGTQRNGIPDSGEDNIADVPMTGVEPMATRDEEDAPAAVVIGLEKHRNDFMMEVALMNVGSRPTVDKVLDCLKHIESPRMQVLYRHLQRIPPEDVILSTSKRPVAMKDLAVERGSWGIRPDIIGSIEEARSQCLEQCMVCPETDRVRSSLSPPIPSSIPVMILYIERQVSRSSQWPNEMLTIRDLHRTPRFHPSHWLGQPFRRRAQTLLQTMFPNT